MRSVQVEFMNNECTLKFVKNPFFPPPLRNILHQCWDEMKDFAFSPVFH